MRKINANTQRSILPKVAAEEILRTVSTPRKIELRSQDKEVQNALDQSTVFENQQKYQQANQVYKKLLAQNIERDVQQGIISKIEDNLLTQRAALLSRMAATRNRK